MGDAAAQLQSLGQVLNQAASSPGTSGNNQALASALSQLTGQLVATPAANQPGSAVAMSHLASLISGLAGAIGASSSSSNGLPPKEEPALLQQQQQPLCQTLLMPQQQHYKASQPRLGAAGALPAVASSSPVGGMPLRVPGGPLLSVEEFVASNQLEDWCVEALHLLDDQQRFHVMATPLNLENTTNLNGVITSRIKEVASVEQRLQMFIRLNNLAEGVVDRLSTLTPEQHEKVMESTLKIQKANNPSGVAMKRITDVLRNERFGVQHGPHMSSPAYRDVLRAVSSPTPVAQSQSNSLSIALQNLANSLQGNASQANVVDRDRSRSRPVAGAVDSRRGNNWPRDVQGFVSDYRLDWWMGEVLARLSLFQRQQVMTELGNLQGVRNTSGVVMARVRQSISTAELLTIFVDLNQIDAPVSEELWSLSEEQQIAVMAPGIYIQNVRIPSTAARSRVRQVLAGNDAMGGPSRSEPQLGAPGIYANSSPISTMM